MVEYKDLNYSMFGFGQFLNKMVQKGLRYRDANIQNTLRYLRTTLDNQIAFYFVFMIMNKSRFPTNKQ